ncbi:RSC complex subunit Rsc9 [Rhodotorula toruloides ATCC 204091]|uniref:RSC complex subunit Rsc9 n=1 Tax=Rhodotorula toruloides TaxID=5286 RepID=A0A2T0AB17_RHOTO|nr:RSC complex subunit Rsc9 [Rhodotorula toruloides ATCC 204091]KAK4334387.1 RSC complex subunit Rsc9 [Rhodotorula toruloides]PRQ75166.1 RSC complex subunit Rsc9 [Rhodotorula toruloides]
MQSAPGRPGQQAVAKPYSQPGVAKPAAPRGTAGQAIRGSQRAAVRERWDRVFGGQAFLEPGPTNRLVLSMRSGIPAEVDFGLGHLVQVTSMEPDLVRFNEMPGLLDGCLALIQDYLERRRADRRRGTPAMAPFVGEEGRDVVRRRAGEAALVLRNLAPEKRSQEPLKESKKLKKVLCEVLEEGMVDELDAEETTEIRVYLLDVLECIAEHIPLALPGHAIAAAAVDDDKDDRPPLKPEPLDSPSVRLFPLLVTLTRSTDRALVLGAFRCLTALALNDKSDAVFALLTYEAVEPLPKPHPHPIQTAIELLPVSDADLSLAILEFLYQHTLLPSNAVLFASRPELAGILRLVFSKFHVRAKLEEVDIDVSMAPFEGKQYHDSHGFKHLRKPTGSAKATEGSLVTAGELARLLPLPEPQRVLTWMRLVFEVDPQGSIQQTELWQAYRAQFESNLRPGHPQMFPAADVIKYSTTAFPESVPMVSEEGGARRFIIKGLKLKDRPELDGRRACKWMGCHAQISAVDKPLTCYQHLHTSHIATSNPPTACQWLGCNYSTSQTEDALRVAELLLHVRTHLPPLSSASLAVSEGSPLKPMPAILHHQRFHAEKEGTAFDSSATGHGFFAALVVRNLGRVAKLAVDARTSAAASAASGKGASGSALVASGNAAIGRLAGDQQSIFEAFAAAAEGSVKKEGVLNRLQKVDYAAGLPLAEALVGVQDALNATVMSDVTLGKILGETALQVEECRRGLKKLRAAASATSQDVEMKVQA